jgi:hypothetical protein
VKLTRRHFVPVLAVGLLVGVDASASPTGAPDRVLVRERVRVEPRLERPAFARTTKFAVWCPEGYTAIAGQVFTSSDDVVTVASDAGVPIPESSFTDPEGWRFELTNYSDHPIHVTLEVTCVKDAPPPPKYFLVARSFALGPGEVRKAEIRGPRFTLPLGFSFRVRSVEGSEPPPGESRVSALTAQPRGGAYRIALRNVGEEAVRVEAGGVFVTSRSAGRTVARTPIVSVTRVLAPRRSAGAAAACARGSTPVTAGWSFPTTGITGVTMLTARGFRFRVSNTSTVARRVRFFGICLVTTPPPGSVPPRGEPYSLGANPVSAQGTFRNGRGGCPVPTSFADRFLFLIPGNGTIRITQPSTGDEVRGRIAPDGSFRLASGRETYVGKISGNRATARYSYTTSAGCTETYDASFVLQL